MEPVWLAAAGAAGSGALASVGYLYRLRSDRKRTTRAALYHLLELHHRVARMHGAMRMLREGFLDLLEQNLRRHGIGTDDVPRKQFEAVGRTLAKALAESQLEAIRETIGAPLEKVLDELAKDDPFLAFRIRGRDSVASFAGGIAGIGKELRIPDAVFTGAPVVIDDAITEATGDLSEQEVQRALLHTAWSVGAITWLRCRLLLRSDYSSRYDEDHAKLLRGLFDRVLPSIKNSAEGGAVTQAGGPV